MTARRPPAIDPAEQIREHQGRTIRQLRTTLGLTGAELARRVGVTPGAVSQWETGRWSPRQHHQAALAHALGVPWSAIFSLDGLAVARCSTADPTGTRRDVPAS